MELLKVSRVYYGFYKYVWKFSKVSSARRYSDFDYIAFLYTNHEDRAFKIRL